MKLMVRGADLRLVAAVLFAVLCSCATVNPADGTATRVYVGVVRVVVPKTQGRLTAYEVQTLGFGWDEGFYLGWRSGSWVIADPSDCQLLVVIKSPVQVENAVTIIKSLEGQSPCIVDHTGLLRP